ncbi:zf-TFIIB domain-containing protein [Thermicanus aegyptius]|uniref:TFIIB-type zinc ribbon-containing protein n=1 Tax=Thermicanus aegyptius TaxID=94009 RepID=UPI0003FE5FE9|nr:zf-TFIIB domain-containing protein [Thermicanus aegyptius]
MKCPVCETTDLLMAERQGVEIDYCPKCRGVWLDRGELDKIIERSRTISRDVEEIDFDPKYGEAKRYPTYGGEYGYPKKHKKKKSFLEDFFDFD